MAFNIVNLVWRARSSVLRPSIKLVALRLADRAHKDGTNARPSVGSISYDTGLSKRHVQYALRELEAKGILVVEKYEIPEQSKPRSYRFNSQHLKEIRQPRYRERHDPQALKSEDLDELLALSPSSTCDAPPHEMQHGSVTPAPKPPNNPSNKSSPKPSRTVLLREIGELNASVSNGKTHYKRLWSTWHQLWERSEDAPDARKLLMDLIPAIDQREKAWKAFAAKRFHDGSATPGCAK